MRHRIRTVLLSLALCLPLALPPAAAAQAFPRNSDDIVDLTAAKKKRQFRQHVILAISGIVITLIFVFIILNSIDRSAARAKLRRQQQEREQAQLE